MPIRERKAIRAGPSCFGCWMSKPKKWRRSLGFLWVRFQLHIHCARSRTSALAQTPKRPWVKASPAFPLHVATYRATFSAFSHGLSKAKTRNPIFSTRKRKARCFIR
jgi:hypothetical protein